VLRDAREAASNPSNQWQGLANGNALFYVPQIGRGIPMAKKLNRISEANLLIPTLRKLASQPNGRMSTSRLIVELEMLLEPSGDDAKILEGRHDTHFSQIVRNMVSHKTSPGNIIAEGFAIHLGPRRGLEITDAGRLHLKHHDEK
jgi:hypothetical protein